jgi:hypothetical protein
MAQRSKQHVGVILSDSLTGSRSMGATRASRCLRAYARLLPITLTSIHTSTLFNAPEVGRIHNSASRAGFMYLLFSFFNVSDPRALVNQFASINNDTAMGG